MMRKLFGIIAAVALLYPCAAWCCDGTAGHDVAITFDGRTFTVSNIGHQWLQVTFTAWNKTYDLQLAPGQSDSPRSPGIFSQPMLGYQSCTAMPVVYR